MHLLRSPLLDRAPLGVEALLAQQVMAKRDFDPSRLLLPSRAWKAFTPSFTSLVNVGSPTITGRFIQGDGRVFFQVKIVPGTTSASTAGTTYFTLPTTAAAEGITGDGAMTDLTTKVSIGVVVIDVANSRCYTPTQAATGDSMIISGWYEG
jgi:hypothetical protein